MSTLDLSTVQQVVPLTDCNVPCDQERNFCPVDSEFEGERRDCTRNSSRVSVSILASTESVSECVDPREPFRLTCTSLEGFLQVSIRL